MTYEVQLTNKKYYESFLDKNNHSHSVQVLGEIYFQEQKNELYDLSSIRFAQGEVYFHHKDYESAIFKWESIRNELEPWAKKNTADAYMELGLMSNAEDLYNSIVSDSPVLNAEIGLKLFALYIDRGNLERAEKIIKRVISVNPDYKNVTELARQLYEDHGDWKNAIELAVDEGIRTESVQWFLTLKTYVDNGAAVNMPSDYFEKPLITLYKINKPQFELLLSSLWHCYEKEETFLQWIKTINHLFSNLDINNEDNWDATTLLFQQAYHRLIRGQYFIKKIEPLMPAFFKNWLNAANDEQAPSICGAILAWNDYLPSSLPASVVQEAETGIGQRINGVGKLEDRIELLLDIVDWAEEQHIDWTKSLNINGVQLEFEHMEDLKPVIVAELEKEMAVNREDKLLLVIRNFINSLLEKRVEQENFLLDAKKWNEEMLSKMNGAINQLNDLQQDKSKIIKKIFNVRKEEVRDSILNNVPGILRGCADFIKDNSDFKNIEDELNDEMNLRIQQYLNETISPKFKSQLQEWISSTVEVFSESEKFIEEMQDGFNALFGEERLKMECDIQVVKDWRRDINRMTGFVPIEKINILKKFTPAQFILKSAGKLLGAIPKNNKFLSSQYQKMIENGEFHDEAKLVADRFLQQFELFERSMDRDIEMFFQQPFDILNDVVEDLKGAIKQTESDLNAFKTKPEQFHDPLTLFEIRHRQYEWMNIDLVHLTKKQ